MPNYCSNLLRVASLSAPSEAVPEHLLRRVRRRLRGPNGPVDFNRILPLPARLADVSCGGQMIDGVYHTVWRTVVRDGRRVCLPIPESTLAHWRASLGADNPIGWCIAHWGTKWNALCEDREWQGNAIGFDTAWTPPLPVVEALSRAYPSLQFTLQYHEDAMDFSGASVFVAGDKVLEESHLSGSEAYQLNARECGAWLATA